MPDYVELLKKLGHLEQLLVLLTRTQLEPVLRKELADPRMQKLNDLTGTHSQRELNKELNMFGYHNFRGGKRREQIGLLVREGKSTEEYYDVRPNT